MGDRVDGRMDCVDTCSMALEEGDSRRILGFNLKLCCRMADPAAMKVWKA